MLVARLIATTLILSPSPRAEFGPTTRSHGSAVIYSEVHSALTGSGLNVASAEIDIDGHLKVLLCLEPISHLNALEGAANNL